MDGHNRLFLPYMGVSQAVPSQGKVGTVLGTTLLMDNQPYSHRPALLLSPSALLNITVPYWGKNRPEMPSQASVVTAGSVVEPILQSHTTSGLSDGLTLEQLHLIYNV